MPETLTQTVTPAAPAAPVPAATYRQKIYDNLTAAYGQTNMPDYNTFNAKLDTVPGYAQKIHQNLQAAYGDATPKAEDWWKKMNTPSIKLSNSGLPDGKEMDKALQYAIQKSTKLDEIPDFAPVDPQKIMQDKYNEVMNTFTKGSQAEVQKQLLN